MDVMGMGKKGLKALNRVFGRIRRMEPEPLVALFVLVIMGAASLACVSAGDEASTTSSTSTTDASITGQVSTGGGLAALATLSGVHVSTDRGNYSTTTDASGNYTLRVAGNNTYNVIAAADGYKTVVAKEVYVGSGKTVTRNLEFTQILAANEKTYLGSGRCKLCHSSNYNKWYTSAHRFGLTAPTDSPGVLPALRTLFEAGTNLSSVPAFNAFGTDAPILGKTGDTYTITIGALTYNVSHAMGWQWKQRFVTKIGQAHYVLPLQWNTATETWVRYNTGNWYKADNTDSYTSATTLESDIMKSKSWEVNCMGCHSVTGILSIELKPSSVNGIIQHHGEYTELGIGCEACHGPASAHVWGNGAVGTTENPKIINPSKLTRDRQNDVCGACHSRGVSVGKLAGVPANPHSSSADSYTMEYYYDGTRTFRPGDTLVAYYTDKGGYWPDSFTEKKLSKQHHQQWNDFYQSGHTAPGAKVDVTCGSCHDAHGSRGYARQMKLSTDDNSLCLSCHGPDGNAQQRFFTGASILQHTSDSHTTYTPGTNGTGRCVSCHALKSGNSSVTGKTTLGGVPFTVTHDITNHTFRTIRPHESARFFAGAYNDTVPNSCQTYCHNATAGLGTSWGAQDSTGANLAAQNWDTHIQYSRYVKPYTPVGRIKGKVYNNLAGGTFTDTFGFWVTIDGMNRSAVTNRNGDYSLSVYIPGTYTIRVIKPGYGLESTVIAMQQAGGSDSTVTKNFTMTPLAAGGESYAARPYRCEICHGGTINTEWKQSRLTGTQLSEEFDDTTIELSTSHGHANIPNYSYSSTFYQGAYMCQKCHEQRTAMIHLQTGDTLMRSQGALTSDTFLNTRDANTYSSKYEAVGQHCLVCHKPHSDVAGNNPFYALRQYRSTRWDTSGLYGINHGNIYLGLVHLDSSPAFPASYGATVCFYCHSLNRNGSHVRDSDIQGPGVDIVDTFYAVGTGMRYGTAADVTSTNRAGQGYGPQRVHGYPEVDGIFGVVYDEAVAGDTPTSSFEWNFDSFTWPGIGRPNNSTHGDTLWGNAFTYQAMAYTTGGVKLLYTETGAPVTRTDTFTCVTCHMWRANAGKYDGSTWSSQDDGHTWKPDVRACALCHDANYKALYSVTANGAGTLALGTSMTATTGNATWGAGAWGINTNGKHLGTNITAGALMNNGGALRDNGGTTDSTLSRPGAADGVKNDFDGDGVQETLQEEIEGLEYRIVAAMDTGWYSGVNSGIRTHIGSSDTGFLGDTITASNVTYSQFGNPNIASRTDSNGNILPWQPDEVRIAWNYKMIEEQNKDAHNPRFMIEMLRAMWTVAGRMVTGVPSWQPPGDDY